MKKLFVFLLVIIPFLLQAQTKNFFPKQFVSSNGRPLPVKTVIAYPTGTTSNGITLTWHRAGEYYTTSAVASGDYDAWYNSTLYLTKVSWGITSTTLTNTVVYYADTTALKAEQGADIKQGYVASLDARVVRIDSTYIENGFAFNSLAATGEQWVIEEYHVEGIARPEWFGVIDNIDDEIQLQAAADALAQSTDLLSRGAIHLRTNTVYHIDSDSLVIKNKIMIEANGAFIHANVDTPYFNIRFIGTDYSGTFESQVIGGLRNANIICPTAGSNAIYIGDITNLFRLENIIIYSPWIGIEDARITDGFNENLSFDYVSMELVRFKGLYITSPNATRSNFGHMSFTDGNSNIRLIDIASGASIFNSHFDYLRIVFSIPTSGANDFTVGFYSEGAADQVSIDNLHVHVTQQTGIEAYSFWLASAATGGVHITAGTLGKSYIDIDGNNANITWGQPIGISEFGMYEDFEDNSTWGRRGITRPFEVSNIRGFNLSSIAGGGLEQFYIFVPGARAGNTASISPTIKSDSLLISGYVSGRDTVTVNAYNPGVTAYDMDSTTFTAIVNKSSTDIQYGLEWIKGSQGTITETDSGIVMTPGAALRGHTHFFEGYWNVTFKYLATPTSSGVSVYLAQNYYTGVDSVVRLQIQPQTSQMLIQKFINGLLVGPSIGSGTAATVLAANDNASHEWTVQREVVAADSVNWSLFLDGDNITQFPPRTNSYMSDAIDFGRFYVENNSDVNILLQKVFIHP